MEKYVRFHEIAKARGGVHVILEGNQWCAVFNDFINLQESAAGFGETVPIALSQLARESRIDSSPLPARPYPHNMPLNDPAALRKAVVTVAENHDGTITASSEFFPEISATNPMPPSAAIAMLMLKHAVKVAGKKRDDDEDFEESDG
jgi:hypothetical protein